MICAVLERGRIVDLDGRHDTGDELEELARRSDRTSMTRNDCKGNILMTHDDHVEIDLYPLDFFGLVRLTRRRPGCSRNRPARSGTRTARDLSDDPSEAPTLLLLVRLFVRACFLFPARTGTVIHVLSGIVHPVDKLLHDARVFARMYAREQLSRVRKGLHGHRLEGVVRGYVLEHLGRRQGLFVLPRMNDN